MEFTIMLLCVTLIATLILISLTAISALRTQVSMLESELNTANMNIEYWKTKYEMTDKDLTIMKQRLYNLQSDDNWRERNQMGCF